MKRWQDRLGDKAYVLSFTGYRKRQELMKEEISRVGIDAEFIWGFPTPFPSAMLKSSGMQHEPALDNPSYIGNWLSHYRMAKTGYELGYDRVLIMEDDCRFLTDLSEIEEYMEDFPDDADMVMLDYGLRDRVKYEQFCRANPEGNWIRTDGKTRLTSAACYSMNRNALRAYIGIFEDTLAGKYGLKAFNVDSYWNQDYMLRFGANAIAMPKTNLAIQTTIEDVEHGFYERYMLKKYSAAGVIQENYGYRKK